VTSTPHIQLEALHRLARALAGGEFRARSMLERACGAVADGFGFERVGIIRYVPETAMLIPFAAHGLTDAERAVLPAALPISRFSTFERALVAGVATHIADPSREEAIPAQIAVEFGIGAFVVVPLMSDGRCLGFMTCDERGAPFGLGREEIELVTTFGVLIAAFLDRAIQHGELRRLNELKSQFAALASHELRTPVAAIYGAIETLEAREHELTPLQRHELRRMLARQAKRLYELVENLLDLSRLEADAIRIEPIEIGVRGRVEEIVAAVFETADDVEIDVPDDLRVMVDPQAFDRILSNLVANASRHGAPPFRVSARREAGELSVAVEDHGGGIAPEFIGSLFERFTRGVTRASEGAGLGLSIAQSYARAHGGTLVYEPARPSGARFRLGLPVA